MEINPNAPLVTRKEIFIQASPEVVWNTHTNINAWHEWQPDISKSQLPHFLDTALDVWIKHLKTRAEGNNSKSSFSSHQAKLG